ncbi:thiol-disulfide oxidoreductase ResA domain protein [Clostridiales bacterium oral taxon 876 str. F0540]|nr:thiol-disulfide oxidoreductase ResA domain protein [Clostridiales bacterium oral taxon 876 str. F0540]
MKKTLIALGLLVMIGGSTYTVYNYNKSLSKSPAAITDKQNTASSQNQTSTANSFTLKQYSNNTASTNKTTSEDAKVKASDFKIKDLNGKEVSLSDYKGKKVFLNFWASWCPPCKAEMPDIERLYQETKDSDLVILAVNLAEDNTTVQNFIKNNKYSFPVLLDPDNDAAIKYQIVSIPTSYFIDKEGNVVAKHIGSMTLENMKSYINNIK